MRWLRKVLFGISEEEVEFAVRGFRRTDPAVVHHLETVGASFVRGYTAGLEESRQEDLVERLEAVPAVFRGFAYEGAAMALTLRDATVLRGRRLHRFLAGPGDAHTYLVHVGAGWALARLPGSPGRALARLHPIQRWLALDGWGFHDGFFHPREMAREHRVPRRIRGYGRRAFDQGLGRSLWFVEGADVEAIGATIDAFPEDRREDLWSGTALAATYAGGVDRAALERLAELADSHRPAVAQGAIFAAEARRRAANSTPATEMACEILAGLSITEASRWSEEAGVELPPDRPGVPAFEVWRQRLQQRWRQRWTTRGNKAASSAATA